MVISKEPFEMTASAHKTMKERQAKDIKMKGVKQLRA